MYVCYVKIVKCLNKYVIETLEFGLEKNRFFFSIHRNKNSDLGFRYIERKHRCF
jgi:hypothetical protein